MFWIVFCEEVEETMSTHGHFECAYVHRSLGVQGMVQHDRSKFMSMVIAAIPTGALVYLCSDRQVLMLLEKTTTLYFLFQVLVNARLPGKFSSDLLHPCDSRVTTVELCHHLSPCRWKNKLVSPEDTVILDGEFTLSPAVGNKSGSNYFVLPLLIIWCT